LPAVVTAVLALGLQLKTANIGLAQRTLAGCFTMHGSGVQWRFRLRSMWP
jgi:hypothetical protein